MCCLQCPDAENPADTMHRSPTASNLTADPGLLSDLASISGNESPNPVDSSLHGGRQSWGPNHNDSSCDAVAADAADMLQS
jgi:hypothetical protein